MPDQPRRPRKPGGAGRSGSGGGRSSQSGRSSSSGGTSRRGGAPGRSGGRGAGDAQGGHGRRGAPTDGGDRGQPQKRRRDLKGAAANLPNWVIEDLARVTPDHRVAGALEALGEASEAFGEGSYHRAVKKAQAAKALAPRDTTVREILGLAAYRVGDWHTALAELRTFRRLAGETTHMPVEMDVLRALGRSDDVVSTWEQLQSLGGKPAVRKEALVVYASHLVDLGDLDGAWDVVSGVRPGNAAPFDEDLRVWYVAARIAALRGSGDTARGLRNAILEADPGFPGIDDLERLIAAT